MPIGRRLLVLSFTAPLPALAQKDGSTLGVPGAAAHRAPRRPRQRRASRPRPTRHRRPRQDRGAPT